MELIASVRMMKWRTHRPIESLSQLPFLLRAGDPHRHTFEHCFTGCRLVPGEGTGLKLEENALIEKSVGATRNAPLHASIDSVATCLDRRRVEAEPVSGADFDRELIGRARGSRERLL